MVSDDIADTVQAERFREIMETKKRVTEVRDEIEMARANGSIREGAAIGLFHRKVRDYVMAVETVLDPANGSPSRYWEDERIGDFTLPDDRHKDVVGLAEFLELETVFEVEVETERQRSYRHKRESINQIQRVRPPERIIERAFRVTNQALDDAGFDLEEPTERQESHFDSLDDVEKATKILEYLQQLKTEDLKEAKREIDRLISNQNAQTNGQHE